MTRDELVTKYHNKYYKEIGLEPKIKTYIHPIYSIQENYGVDLIQKTAGIQSKITIKV